LTGHTIQCSACQWPLPSSMPFGDDWLFCPACGRRMLAKLFPALVQGRTAGTVETLTETSEASCFFHEQNRASRPCDQCGRFLCSLCELEVSGRILCPTCLDDNLRGRKVEELESGRTMHDSIALSLAIIPMLFFWPVLLTAPLTLYWIVRYWRSPRSIVGRTRVRYYLAALIALAQIAMVVVVIFAFWSIRR
jgi:hypothetical protein